MRKKLFPLILLPALTVSCASKTEEMQSHIDLLTQEVNSLKESVTALQIENEEMQSSLSFMTDDINNVWEYSESFKEFISVMTEDLNNVWRHFEAIESKNNTDLSAAQLEKNYLAAIQSYKDRQFAECRKELDNIIQAAPDNKLMGNLLYWKAETYYAENNMKEALKIFEEVIKLNKTKVPDAMLKAGYSQYNLKNNKSAKATLNSLIKKYPKSSAARLAKSKLKRMS